MSDDFFIGWSADPPKADRRFLFVAATALVGGAALGGWALGARNADPGAGAWDQGDVRDYVGTLVADPYPALLLATEQGVRTAYLATYGKRRVSAEDMAAYAGSVVTVRGSAITRGARTMIAAVDGRGWIRPGTGAAQAAGSRTVDLGAATIIGEILDAKCWFGAMRPAVGKTHKACAALCARGGLPLAFCALKACGDALDAPLFVDEHGRAHDQAITPLVADAVLVSGRMVQVDDVVQFRAARRDIRSL